MSDTGIFNAAVKLSPERRAAYLDQACGTNHALRREVESLLQAHDQPGSFLQSRLARPAPTVDEAPITEKPGTVIGPYKLLQQIGEGGMGVVYMAEQQEPIRRKVALKIIKPGMDSQQVVARFEAERQALAMMDHQNIARVLDAGTTESGLPYFVMELVHGVPITRFCDDNKLTPHERLALFVPVCQAIQHAHQKGIIHRDVKPSNVLVTMYDDKPVPKVIDFGVAKAMEQRLTEKSLFTQFGALVGTLQYMSPEQAEMNAFGVDTRSDIYSLGVLLYELLTGTTPLERTRMREVALDELVRLIREEEAPRPSLRLSSSNNLPKIAAARKTESARLSKLVRGEIDWIVMKCLEKDRSRRYDTASGLGRDVERYLADEPVEACPPSASYRLRKFARKHKKALAATAAFALLLVAGVVVSTLLAVWATSAEKEADKQRDEARVTAYASGIGLAQRAWEENNLDRTRELLEEVPREAAGRNLHGFEWIYLSRLCHPDELTLYGHGGLVKSVAFSPDGRRLASAGGNEVKVWDSVSGKELFALTGHVNNTVACVAFSPDGQRLVSGSWDGIVKVWDSMTGKELFALKGVGGRPEPGIGAVMSVAFSPDGKRLASGHWDNFSVKIWDSATGMELLTLKGGDGVNSVAFSPDGERLASGSADGTVKIWDSVAGKELFALKGHLPWVTSVAFSPDGQRLVSGSWDGIVKLWDSMRGKELVALKGHAGHVNSVAFSPDGERLASGSTDGTVKIWDSVTGKDLFALRGAGAVMSVAFSADGQRLASGSGEVKIWDIVTNNELFSFKGHTGAVMSVAFSPDGQRLASGGNERMVKIWESMTGKELFALKGYSGRIDSAGMFSPDAQSVAFSPDGQRLASGSFDKTVKVWDSATGKELFALKGHAGPVASVVFSPDGRRLASGSHDETVKVWDTATGRELFSLEGLAGWVMSVAFSPDSQRLASAGFNRNTMKIWDSTTGKELLSVKGAYGVTSVAFSPDGRCLALGSADQTVKIWDSATGKALLSLKGHNGRVTSVAFSPDGQRLATGSEDKTVKIWDSVTGKELFSFKGRAGRVWSVAFSPDGQRLSSANDDGSINQWETTTVSPEIQQRRAANQRETKTLLAKPKIPDSK